MDLLPIRPGKKYCSVFQFRPVVEIHGVTPGHKFLVKLGVNCVNLTGHKLLVKLGGNSLRLHHHLMKNKNKGTQYI